MAPTSGIAQHYFKVIKRVQTHSTTSTVAHFLPRSPALCLKWYNGLINAFKTGYIFQFTFKTTEVVVPQTVICEAKNAPNSPLELSTLPGPSDKMTWERGSTFPFPTSFDNCGASPLGFVLFVPALMSTNARMATSSCHSGGNAALGYVRRRCGSTLRG